MSNVSASCKPIELDIEHPIWDQFFCVTPLVVVGTRDDGGSYDLAPKHMAMPLSWNNYFGFVCAPSHTTYRNIERERAFTVSFPRPDQIVLASLAADPRGADDVKPALAALPTFPASKVDGVLFEHAYLFFECELERIVDGFGPNSLIAGTIVAAQVCEDALRHHDRDDQDLLLHAPLLAYLAPGRYATIDRSFSFPFPIGFKR